jgi:hypothetical protein
MAELQKALSDSHLAIYDEKMTVNALKLDYEDLVKVEKTDLKRITELEHLNKDISSKLNYANFKDCRPNLQKNTIKLSKKEKALKKGSDEKRLQGTMAQLSQRSNVSIISFQTYPL